MLGILTHTLVVHTQISGIIKTCPFSDFCHSLIWLANLPLPLPPIIFLIKINLLNFKHTHYLSIILQIKSFIASVLYLRSNKERTSLIFIICIVYAKI